VSRRLRIENCLDALRPMSEWLAESCEALGISDDLSYRFDLAANEAVANTISHGYAPGARGAIELCFDLTHGHAILVIEDDGNAFNPLELAEPSPASSIEDSRIGGLGVLLIRRSMGQCEYQRRGGRNVLTLKSPVLEIQHESH
jgi:serine/threonine-protein kinase RsbW